MYGVGAQLHNLGFFGNGNLTDIGLAVKKFGLRMKHFVADGSVMNIFMQPYVSAMEVADRLQIF